MRKVSIIIVFVLGIAAFSCRHKPVIPRPDHIVVVIEENHKYNEIIGSPNAPFITGISKDAASFTDSHGVTHPSQPNYLAFFSGNLQGVTNDNCADTLHQYTTMNLGASLIKHGFTFKGYAQGLPAAGSKICYDSVSSLTGGHVYGKKHCPWINWQGNQENQFPDSLSRPMTDFPKDFNQLPTVAFVIPDMDHDMHNIGRPGDSAAIRRGDDWMRENLSAYIDWAKTHNSLLIFTFDEDDMTPQNRIPTLFIGQQVKTGNYAEKINHFDVLRTIEKMYDLPKSFDDTTAHEITDVWKVN